jgi:hypothetical protein
MFEELWDVWVCFLVFMSLCATTSVLAYLCMLVETRFAAPVIWHA